MMLLVDLRGMAIIVPDIPYSGLFSRGKIFTNLNCYHFSR